jgi:SAM-dependent methyltransferase
VPVSKFDKTEINAQIAASIKNFSLLAKDEAARQRYIIEMPEFIQQKAQLISAHILLTSGARVVDMGCETGEVTYMLAALNPRAEIIGIDSDQAAIEFARRTYRLPNLSFRIGDISIPDMEDESLDGIVNSNILHLVYSRAGYDTGEITALLEKQMRKLKTGGTMLVRDYIMPPEDEYVLMELPNVPSPGADTASLSDADLLISYAQTARPIAAGCEGFFIEERMPRREGTRLFRLPHKWAVEFVHRKNYRANWERELHNEYTFFTWQDYRREMTRLGMRMVFSAPYWNPWVVKNSFQGRFQLFDDGYKPLDPPATNYFIVGQKVADKQSLLIEERRPSQKPASELQIMVVRDNKDGSVHELVKRPGEYCDVVPYRITHDNRLVVYVRSGYPRPIVNAVLRGSNNLDGKRWSGHLIEPVTMDTASMTDDVEQNRAMIFDYITAYSGLRPKSDDAWYVGDTYFPAPDRIDEAIEPVFIEVENPNKTIWPITADKDIGFVEPGTMTELDATEIILASQVGLLPEPRLEMHVIELMTKYQLPLPRWIGEIPPPIPGDLPPAETDVADLLKDIAATKFEPVKTAPAILRAVKSVFVEEGKVGRTTRGLSAQDVEFILTEDGVENIAIVIPLSRSWDDNILVALDPKMMPVPNRMGGDGAMLTAPSFVLPRDMRTITEAKAWIAQKFKVPPEQVGQLGESYFTHTGVTPQRVYPFMVAAPGSATTGTHRKWVRLNSLWRHLRFSRSHGDLLKALTRVQLMISHTHDMSVHRNPINLKQKDFSLSTDKTVLEAKIDTPAVPSRVLGQRGSVDGGTLAHKKEAEIIVVPDEKPADAKPEPVDVTPAIDEDQLRAQRNAQAAVESLVDPHIGKRLTQSYAQAMGVLQKMQVTETPTVQKVDAEIDLVANQLKRAKLLELTLEPPKPKGAR